MVFPSLLLAMMMSATHSRHTARAGSYGKAKHSHYTVHGLILPSNRTAAYKETEKRELIMNMVKFNFCCRYHLLSCPRSKSWLCAGRLHSSALSHTSLHEEERERWLHKPIFKGNVSFHGIPMYLNGFCSFVSWLRHCSTTLDVHWFTLLFW